jgi:thiol:disulfide interchange protein DsbD
MTATRYALATLLLLAFSFLNTAAMAQSTLIMPSNQDDFLPVEEAYRVEVVSESASQLRVLWQIAPDYYLYQHQFAFSLENDPNNSGVSARYSQALAKTDEYFGDVEVYYDFADITLTASMPLVENAILTITSQGCADAGLCYPPRKDYFQLTGALGEAQPISAQDALALLRTSEAPTQSADALILMLAFAFAGGIILNLMPCVFPILSLKILSFAGSDSESNHRHGWFYSLGVIVSFASIAALLIGLKSAGEAIGWGFQLQSPIFVSLLALLFLAMAFSLAGLTEIGTSWMGVGGSLTAGDHNRSSFFTGVLAVVVASPCTAPFMGTALGFALTQPTVLALSVFIALGAGMASPMLALSYSQWLRNRIPKPGAWMVTLRQALSLPLFLTVIWLLWVAGRQTSIDTFAGLLVACVLLGMGLWWSNSSGLKRLSSLIALLLCAGTTYASLTLERTDSNAAPAFSRSHLAETVSGANPVFVDVTADWCITCIANEKAVLETDGIQQAFQQQGVIYYVIDWTNYDPAVAKFLEEFQRNGIPFYLVYPGNNRPPQVLPQILTKQIVLDAIKAL